MDDQYELTALDDAIRHVQAGLKALEVTRERAKRGEALYPTHLFLASVELSQAVETALKIGLRHQ